jgi:16S rRNA (guanine1207-N2)-methyltransferase
MNDHYYTVNPTSEHDVRRVSVEVLGNALQFDTDAGVFSRDGLDTGTQVLLEALPPLSGRILDLGCGWGPVGTALGKKYPEAEILLTDLNARAAELAARNLNANGVKNAKVVQGDGYENADGKFNAIVLNPPIRTGKNVIYGMFADAKSHLTENGALYIVIRKQQGAESAEKYLKTLYASVERISREKGYWVLRCTDQSNEEQ